MNHVTGPVRLHVPRHPRGQSLVEFALVLPVMLVLMLAVVDAGRGIMAYNEVSQSARDIARVASVSCTDTATPCDPGSGPIQSSIATQRGLIPGTATFAVTCIGGSSGAAAACDPGNYVQVTVGTHFQLITPLVSQWFGPVNVSSVSQLQIIQ